ncbi:N-acetylneuraminate synthase family protein [Gammaproteobacteria bacterium]|nr:N-acetylneuraminate synthase family protein [Gammaproteobacteria bacterium]
MNKPYIIAEIASAHEGDPNDVLKLIDSSVEAKADAIKLQIFKKENLLSSYHKDFDLFKKLEISQQEWTRIFEVSERSGLEIIIEPYDLDSFNFVSQYDFITAFKIPTSDVSNEKLITGIARIEKPVYLGTGGAKESEINTAINLINANKSDSQIILMHGFQNFPTAIEDCNLSKISYLSGKYKTVVGYADHTDSDDYLMRTMIPSLALSFGAEVIEKHITLDRSKKGADYYSSLDPDEFKEFVHLLKSVTTINGSSGDWVLSKAELDYRINMKKFAVMKHDMHKGQVISEGDISFRRIDTGGISPSEITQIYGRTLNKTIKRDHPITISDINNE